MVAAVIDSLLPIMPYICILNSLAPIRSEKGNVAVHILGSTRILAPDTQVLHVPLRLQHKHITVMRAQHAVHATPYSTRRCSRVHQVPKLSRSSPAMTHDMSAATRETAASPGPKSTYTSHDNFFFATHDIAILTNSGLTAAHSA